MRRNFGNRILHLPPEGTLLFATDLHGNLRDYKRLRTIYDAEEKAGNKPFLLFCGDLVHGPNPEMNFPGAWPEHLGSNYVDKSAELIRDFIDFSSKANSASLLGNHEHAHIGGPRLGKFHLDEVAVLERALGRNAKSVRQFFRSFPLIATSTCGAVFTHAAPAATEPSVEAFEALQYVGYEHVSIWRMTTIGTLGSLLWSRSATPSQAQAMLKTLSDHDEMTLVAYGHDIVDRGYDKVGLEQICLSTSFGLMDERKVYLRLDLSSFYPSVEHLREGHEIRPLYE